MNEPSIAEQIEHVKRIIRTWVALDAQPGPSDMQAILRTLEAHERAMAVVEAARQVGLTSHMGHWDKTGGSGSGCPECHRQRDWYNRLQTALRAYDAALPPADASRTDHLHIIVAAMLREYDQDEQCDYQKINRMIEEASDVVSKRIGGLDRLHKLAEHYTPDAIWELLEAGAPETERGE